MITKRDVLHAIGAETDDRFMTGMLIGIGVGAIVGSAVAVLLAPKTGNEMRHLIGERGSDLIEKARTKVGLTKNGGSREAAGTIGETMRDTVRGPNDPIR